MFCTIFTESINYARCFARRDRTRKSLLTRPFFTRKCSDHYVTLKLKTVLHLQNKEDRKKIHNAKRDTRRCPRMRVCLYLTFLPAKYVSVVFASVMMLRSLKDIKSGISFKQKPRNNNI